MEAALLYITATNREEAISIAHELVNDRLVACANVLDHSTAVYWWQGEVQQDSESVIIAKTRKELVERVIERVKKIHSYNCPCILAMPITHANPEYLMWIEKETVSDK